MNDYMVSYIYIYIIYFINPSCGSLSRMVTKNQLRIVHFMQCANGNIWEGGLFSKGEQRPYFLSVQSNDPSSKCNHQVGDLPAMLAGNSFLFCPRVHREVNSFLS